MESMPALPAETAAHGAAPRRPWISPHSRRSLAISCLLTALYMVVQQRAALLGRPDPPLATLLRSGVAITYLEWLFTDARLRGSPFSGGGKLAMAFIAPISVPCYVLWTRRFRGLFVSAIALAALCAAGIVGGLAARALVGVPLVE